MKRVPSILLITLVALSCSAWFTPPQIADVPAYNAAPPKKGESLPPILAGEQLTGPSFKFGYQVQAYRLAAKIPNVIYQQPCYCHCDRSVGHKSLHSCYESEHGAHCGTCLQELYYSYQMTKAGKTPAQIRAGIENHEWEKIDLTHAAAMN
jgi:hypothetical protein